MASRICWNCGKDSHQTRRGEVARAEATPTWFAMYRCDHCGFGSVAELQTDATRTAAAVTAQMDRPDANITWHPARSLGRRFDDVPEPIAPAASEVWACFSISQYRSAVLMARAVVEAVAKDKGATTGNLSQKINKLYEDETIGRGLKDAAHEIRYLGNDMAHGDFVTDITEEAAADVLNFLEELLNEAYQRDARLNRMRAYRAHANGDGETDQ